jgi:hypothetical protein
MKLTSLLLLAGLLWSLGSCYVFFPKRHYRKAQEKAPYDVIIVPGFPMQATDTTWHEVIKIRMLWSTFLLHNGTTKNIIYSGADVHSPYVEAVYMSLYGKEIGVPEENMYLDTIANHSSENVFYGFLLARELGFKKIALATDPFQAGMMRPVRRKVKRIFKHKVDHIPIVFDTIRVLDSFPNPTIDPAPAFRENHISLVDQEGFFKRLSGTLGMKIDWKKHRKEQRALRKAERKRHKEQ